MTDFIEPIRYGDTSTACLYIKTRLHKLGYFSPEVAEIKKASYGRDAEHAVKAFQAQNTDGSGQPLQVDGIIGALTWEAIEQAYEAMTEQTEISWVRELSYGSSGPDVLNLKQRLRAAAFLPVDPSHSRFGSDTRRAVRDLQAAANLPVTGVVDKATWDALDIILATPAPELYITEGDIPGNISPAACKAILADLKRVSRERAAVVLLALRYAYDPATGPRDYPISLYVRSANLYDKALQEQRADAGMINSGAKNNPSYYDDGRKEMMLAAIKADPDITCADCSGGIVGLMRKLGYVSSGFDTTANNFTSNSHSTAISRAELLPGDWVGFDGHIGLYVGGGYVVEWIGGAYGCQLTKLEDRRRYCFVSSPDGKTYIKGRLYSGTKWTRFRRPKSTYYC